MLFILGVKSNAELEQRSVRDFFAAETVDRLSEQFRKRPDSGFTAEGEVLRPDGTRRQIVLFAAPMPAVEGVATTFIGSIIDITARKEAESQLKKAHEELERRVTERTAELARANALLQDEIAERK